MGYRIEAEGKSIVYSGDTEYCDGTWAITSDSSECCLGSCEICEEGVLSLACGLEIDIGNLDNTFRSVSVEVRYRDNGADKIKFERLGEQHKLKLKKGPNTDYATIEILSAPQTFNILSEQSINVDLNEDGLSDITVTLNGLFSNNGDFWINVQSYDNDEDGYITPADCNDRDENINPGADELCDGIDNNCDTSIDEECGCTEDETRSCGVNTGECEYGVQTCSDDTWGACKGGTNPSTEICDNKDNDCDGSIDENLMQQCGFSDLGICSLGDEVCVSGSWNCDAVFFSTSGELCGNDGTGNELDDDCDGVVDEECIGCTEDETRPCGIDTGECEYGIQTCSEDTWTECVGNVNPVDEICKDNKDNDCDDFTDEWCPLDFDNDNFDNAVFGSFGDDGKELDCEDSNDDINPDAEEICDDEDNDCDGIIDEGCECEVDDDRNCGSDVGACEKGIQICIGGLWDNNCFDRTGPSIEIKDNIDNDCDGLTDEGFGTSGNVGSSGVSSGGGGVGSIGGGDEDTEIIFREEQSEVNAIDEILTGRNRVVWWVVAGIILLMVIGLIWYGLKVWSEKLHKPNKIKVKSKVKKKKKI